MTKINEGRPVEAVELIEAEVRELVRRRGIDPWADGKRIRDLVEGADGPRDDPGAGGGSGGADTQDIRAPSRSELLFVDTRGK